MQMTTRLAKSAEGPKTGITKERIACEQGSKAQKTLENHMHSRLRGGGWTNSFTRKTKPPTIERGAPSL